METPINLEAFPIETSTITPVATQKPVPNEKSFENRRVKLSLAIFDFSLIFGS